MPLVGTTFSSSQVKLYPFHLSRSLSSSARSWKVNNDPSIALSLTREHYGRANQLTKTYSSVQRERIHRQKYHSNDGYKDEAGFSLSAGGITTR